MEENNTQEDIDQSSTPSDGESTDGQPKGRTAEDRIDELLSKVKSATDELTTANSKISDLEARVSSQPVPTPPVEEPASPDVEKAIEFLKSKGKFVDETQLKKEMQAIQDRQFLDNQHQKLESSFDGADGRPKYDRSKTEEYMRTHPVYDPEIAYEQIYKDELLDWNIKKLEGDKRKKPMSTRPSSTSGTETENSTLSREKLKEWLDNPTPENKMKIERNRDKFLKLMAEQKL